MKKIICIFIALVLTVSVMLLPGCGSKAPEEEKFDIESYSKAHPLAVINVKDFGTIYVELYEDVAPNTVNNFISLANSGFYNGVIFHRVIKNFMIQGGDPEGTGYGGPGYNIAGEFNANGFKNELKHTRGVISMARGAYDFNSQGSQFFIMHVDYPSLDGQYSSFGKVISGLDVVDAIAEVKTNSSDKPLTDVVMESVKVETWGVNYPEPVKVK